MVLAIGLWLVAALMLSGLLITVSKPECKGLQAVSQVLVNGAALVVVVLAALEIGGAS